MGRGVVNDLSPIIWSEGRRLAYSEEEAIIEKSPWGLGYL
jgi:hypothetical protein